MVLVLPKLTMAEFCILRLLLLLSAASLGASGGDLKTYVVHVLPKSNATFRSARERIAWHESLLPDKSRLVYSYGKVTSGFAARLNPGELASLELVEGFLQAVPDRNLSLHTTHSPAFLGLSADAGTGLWKDSRFGRGVIVGVLDSGVKVGHPSFSDNGLLPPPPAKWKGVCQYNASDCSNKLIGARAFLDGQRGVPPYDDNGHGTHTASTAVGMFVGGANLDGQANGTAAGLAPYAHLAVYKICGAFGGCFSSDILAGLDKAVEDGVDIVSLSLGDGNELPFNQEAVAVGTFGAVEQGVFVSCSAGNGGPFSESLTNEAPWILTVGASSIDRFVGGTLYLKNGPTITGENFYQPANFSFAHYPLVYPGGAAGTLDAKICLSLEGINVTGKVVLCDSGYITPALKGRMVKDAGGVGMIVANLRFLGYTTQLSNLSDLPALRISYADGVRVKSYIQSETLPMAAIAFNGTILGTTPAPVVAYFSSRGPNKQAPDILKPDIIGPGLNILAAWHVQVGQPTASSTFYIVSGTSMSAPHLSGVAALLKSLHPNWSPAAIKSAIMTTADTVGNDGHKIRSQTLHTADLFATGAGHVNPTKASNPGFVYDIEPGSYIAYLCAALGYSDRQISIIAQRNVTCSEYVSRYGAELNYPSFMARLSAANAFTAVASRTVTNVGEANASYTAKVSSRKKVSIRVNPETLSFTEADQVLRYTVTFSINGNISSSGYFKGYVRWISSDGVITVASPVIVAVDV